MHAGHTDMFPMSINICMNYQYIAHVPSTFPLIFVFVRSVYTPAYVPASSPLITAPFSAPIANYGKTTIVICEKTTIVDYGKTTIVSFGKSTLVYYGYGY